jgi:hypothetical protein
MTEPQDPEPLLPPDHGYPAEPVIEHGPLLTVSGASKLTGHPVRVLQRWIEQGVLPCRYKQASWPHGYLLTFADLEAVAGRRQKGAHKAKAKTYITEGGAAIVLTGKPKGPPPAP